MALLQELNRGGITVVVVTHEQDIAAFASRLLTFRDGKLIGDAANEPKDAAAWSRPAARIRAEHARSHEVSSPRSRSRSTRCGSTSCARSLTMLGIIIGVGAVITMVAVGAGAQARVEDQIKSLGSNLIIILSGNYHVRRRALGSGSQLTITEDDAYAIAREIPASRPRRPHCAAAGRWCSATATGRRRSQGITPEYLEARQWEIASGSAFDQSQVDSAAKVVLLGQTVARSLFGDADPVGETCASGACPTR